MFADAVLVAPCRRTAGGWQRLSPARPAVWRERYENCDRLCSRRRSSPWRLRSRWPIIVELTKPRIAVLVLFTVAAGAWLASRGSLDRAGRCSTPLLGTALVAAGASALNQLLERHSDALMRRTENRPLPAGRLQPAGSAGLRPDAWALGGLRLPGPGRAAAAGRRWWPAFTFVSYVFVYTPLKRMTTLNTLVGAVPGRCRR